MDKKYADRYASIKAKYIVRWEESRAMLTATMKDSQATHARLDAKMEQLMSSVDNLARQRHLKVAFIKIFFPLQPWESP
jgi:hypothetical protein